MIHGVILLNRQGKPRLTKFYTTQINDKDRVRLMKDVQGTIIGRSPKLCNVIEWKEYKLVYRRYASLYFVACCDRDDNELLILEVIHHYVESLDGFFGNVCELDIIFNFQTAYYILDEIIMAGEVQESSRKTVLRLMEQQEILAEAAQDDQSTNVITKIINKIN